MNTLRESIQATDQVTIRTFNRTAKSATTSRGIVMVTLGLLFTIPCAQAQTMPSPADKDFILAAAQGGMTEVKLGELAAQKGLRDDVKAFGQMMVKDHSAINDDLKTLAVKKGVALPDSLNAKHQQMVEKLAALTGAEFDDAYIANMIKDHKMDAKEFTEESTETKDADIKSFVDKSIPVVTQHLSHIKAMKK